MSLQDDLHRAHLERRRKWFPAPPPKPKLVQPPPVPKAEIVDLELCRLIKKAENFEQLFSEARTVDSDEPPQRPSVHVIQTIVARFYGSSVVDMNSERRLYSIIWPRHVAIYLAKEMTLLSVTSIGRIFGGRDHTTVLHAARRVERIVASDERARDEIQLLKMRIIESMGGERSAGQADAQSPARAYRLVRPHHLEFLELISTPRATFPKTIKESTRTFCRQAGLAVFRRKMWCLTASGKLVVASRKPETEQ